MTEPSRGRQRLLAVVATGLLCLVALAGADLPPPPGFALLVLLIAGWSAAVCAVRWRCRDVPRVAQLARTGAAGALLGALAWLAMSVFALLVGGLSIGWPLAIGLAVALVLPGFGGALVAVASWLVVDRRRNGVPGH